MQSEGTYHPDNNIFRLFCSLDRKTAEALYDDCFQLIFNMVQKNGGRPEDGEDVFHEGLIVLVGYCGKEDFKLKVPLKSFLYSICRNIWLKKLKNKGRIKITFVDVWEYVDLEYASEKQRAAELTVAHLLLLKKHFNRLPAHEQKTLRLYYIESKSHKEIAQIMGFADEVSARVQKFRYVRHLQRLVRGDPDFE